MSQISSLSRQKSFDFPGTLKLVVMRERNHAWLNFEARGAIAKESKKCLLQLSNLALNQIRGESRLIIQRIKRDLQQLNAIFAFVQAVAKLVGIIIWWEEEKNGKSPPHNSTLGLLECLGVGFMVLSDGLTRPRRMQMGQKCLLNHQHQKEIFEQVGNTNLQSSSLRMDFLRADLQPPDIHGMIKWKMRNNSTSK